MGESNNHILKTALRHGWSLIPVRANKKAFEGWKEYQAVRATTEQLRSWSAGKPPCWAVVTGTLSGVVCIDFDGEEGLKTLERLGLQPHVETGSGGKHVYVRHPGRHVKTVNGRSDKRLGELYPGLDVRGDGGYAVFYGRSNKGPYTWLRPLEPDPWEILPQELRDYLTGEEIVAESREAQSNGRPVEPYCDPRYWLERYLGMAIIGSRNQMGFNLALQLVSQCVQFGTSVAEAEAIMVEYARRVPHDPKDPYTANDARASLKKALDYGFKPPCGVPTARAGLITGGNVELVSTIDDEQLATYALTDLGNAERFLARHGHNVRYCENFGRWFYWDGCRWKEDVTGMAVQLAAATVRAMLDEAKTLPSDGKNSPAAQLIAHARRSESDNKIKAFLNLAKSWIGVSPDDLDSNPWVLNCRNGLLDLRTGELLPHRADDLITKLVPYEYDPHAECPHWLQFLDRIFDGNQRLIDYIQRAVGYSLTGVIREQCLFFLHGNGANGKSTFLTVVQDILGDYSRDTPTDSLMIKQNDTIPNDIARLKGARLVTAVETEADKRMAESLVKRLTGGDTITARFMRQEFFQFRGTFKIFLAANHKPAIRGTDDAIWRRIKLIPFDVQIPDHEQDPDLPEKLKEEATGILTWMVQGCKAWQAEGLRDPEEVRTATAYYRDEQDFLGPFLQDCCHIEPLAEVGAGELYKAYIDYCETNRQKPISQTRFGRLMTERPGIKKAFSTDKKTRIYTGIGLSDGFRTGSDGFGYYNPCKIKSTIYTAYSTETRPNPSNSSDDLDDEDEL